MTSATVVGSTGLVGSHILSALLSLPSVSNVTALARRTPTAPDPSNKLNAVVDTESSKWPSQLSALKPPSQIFFSGLATTRAQAGGFENQKKIDHDLNVELAKAAAAAGVRVYVLISAAATSTTSNFAYSRMKAELDEAVKELNFEHVVLIQPGLIVGDRADSRPPEAALRAIARFAGTISGGRLKDFWAQDAEVIGKAAVNAGLQCLTGDAPKEKVWVVQAADIIRLGKTEWSQN
ncbi:MAG: Protein fmp52, mitochondrial [Sclerophora amabilis]|nr:MAG: Protein fmp52, mitochondrial [Sclerophora amabilis]